jgi:hypothetical protein
MGGADSVRFRSGCLSNRMYQCGHGTTIPQSPSADCGTLPWRLMSFCHEDANGQEAHAPGRLDGDIVANRGLAENRRRRAINRMPPINPDSLTQRGTKIGGQ